VARNISMIGKFLKARRMQVIRAEYGLPPVGGRKESGLRREEVASLAGVSVTWYSWLEQGRDITPSRHVLDALSRTLRLSAAQHAHLLSLAGYSALRSVAEPVSPTAPTRVQSLLDELRGLPAYAIGSDWGIVAWNTAYTFLYPNVESVAESDRNLLWLLFTDPYMQDLLPDWESIIRSNVAAFRAEAGPRLDDAPYAQLVTRLFEASEDFRVVWESHSIDALSSRRRLFCHPVAGDLHLEQHSLKYLGTDLHLLIYTPIASTDTAARLRQLLD
jgi:transcriptional regulator with XRE-family HTH domain